MQVAASERFNRLGEELIREAGPARKQVQDYYSTAIRGGPEAFKLIAPEVNFTKRQFANARQTMDEGVAPGGARQRGYKQLASAEASSISKLMSDKINEVLARLASFSQFGTQAGIQSTGGMSSAGQALGELAAARGAAVASGVGGIAQGAGMFFGSR